MPGPARAGPGSITNQDNGDNIMTEPRVDWLRKYRRITDDKAMGTLIALADLVIENTDRDGNWEDCIDDQVRETLEALGVLERCDYCDGGRMVSGWVCPRDHPCDTCGLTSCECCSDCQCYPCECCSDCGNHQDSCECCGECYQAPGKCICLERALGV